MRLPVLRLALLSGLAVPALLLSGCALGPITGAPAVTQAAAAFSGTLHGGPTPVVGARVVIYATTSSGYGAGTMLQEATATGTVSHMDTDANGSFSFAGGFTCPTGQFAYIVAYGGNSGSGNNPNSVLMAPVGSCDTLYTGNTVYSGSNIFVNELTTISSAYALGNFMAVTGNPATGLTVGIGSTATNNDPNGCVANGYYTPANGFATTCTTTAAAGLKHAFNLALAMVNNTTGVANNATSNNGAVPDVMFNTLGNILQACVNTTGGGTTAAGAPSSTASSSDGTGCGKLFSYTSYSVGATNLFPTNTLSAMMNLAKRPASTGVAASWDSTCTTSGTANNGVTCLYNLSTPQVFYQPSLSAKPQDFMVSISYPKYSFGASGGVACSTDGLFYPFALALDIQDNVTVLNTDASTPTCFQLIGVAADGSKLFITGATTASARYVATDALGHIIVPDATGTMVRVFDNLGNALTTAAVSKSFTVAADSNNDIWYTAQNGAANLGKLTIGCAAGATCTDSLRHSAPVYTAVSILSSTSAPITGSLYQVTVDNNNLNVWAGAAATTTASIFVVPQGVTSATNTANNTYVTRSGVAGSTAPGYGTVVDSTGAAWDLVSTASAVSPCVASNNCTNTLYKVTIASGTGATAVVNTPAVQPTPALTATPIANPRYLAADGNNTIWVSDAVSAQSYLRGYDSVNNVLSDQYFGCKFQPAAGNTYCGPTTGVSSSTPYELYQTRDLQVDSTGSIWTVTGTQGVLTQIIGIAAPTWPSLSAKTGKP